MTREEWAALKEGDYVREDKSNSPCLTMMGRYGDVVVAAKIETIDDSSGFMLYKRSIRVDSISQVEPGLSMARNPHKPSTWYVITHTYQDPCGIRRAVIQQTADLTAENCGRWEVVQVDGAA